MIIVGAMLGSSFLLDPVCSHSWAKWGTCKGLNRKGILKSLTFQARGSIQTQTNRWQRKTKQPPSKRRKS